MAKDVSVEVNDVRISYRIMNNISIRSTLFHKKTRDEIFEAVKGVTFDVDAGGILGIIGKNGSGKSTLLRAIAGVFSPNSGTINLHDNSVSLMALGVGFKPLLTGRANIMLSGLLLGFKEKEIQNRMEEIIAFAELGDFIDRPVRTYSSGMYSKLAFAITALLETDIMLVDEVLSVGDERFKKKSFEKMQELILDDKRTVILVSHSIDTLESLCDRVMWMDDGEIRAIGEPSYVLKQYTEYMTK